MSDELSLTDVKPLSVVWTYAKRRFGIENPTPSDVNRIRRLLHLGYEDKQIIRQMKKYQESHIKSYERINSEIGSE